MIYDGHHSNMINTADQNTAVISQNFQRQQAGSGTKDSKNKGIPYLNVRKFTQKLHNMASATSTKKCARSIRIALQSAGARILNHPVAAADWGNTLQTIGYKKINPSFDNPKEGDIYIIHRTQKHVYGHIAAYAGNQWVSDFRQKSHAVYKNDQVRYTYYRLA